MFTRGFSTVVFAVPLAATRKLGMSPAWGPALAAIAAIYMAFTIDSAYQHARGRGGMWKGRAQANVSEMR